MHYFIPKYRRNDRNFWQSRKQTHIKVLRKKDTDILFVTNGEGYLFETEITLASDSKCTVKIFFEKKPRSKYHYI
jgi:16S rRNA (uracil1498-N3)-methyltransferase